MEEIGVNVPDVDDVNISVVHMNRCEDVFHLFLFIAAEGVLKHRE